MRPNRQITGADAAVFSITTAIPTVLEPAMLAGFTVQLSGATAGTFNATITIFNNDSDESEFGFPISGTITSSIPPEITAQVALATPINTPITLELEDFTVTDPDNTYPDDFTLTVNAGTNYTVSGTTITPSNDFFGTLTVPVFVNDGENNSPVFDAIVSVEAGQIDVEVDGQSLINGDNITFNDALVGTQETQQLVITNTGTIPLVISNIIIDGTEFSLVSQLPGPIAPGGSATLVISFNPTSVGSKTATLTIISDSVADFVVTLTANGISETPEIEVINVVTPQQNGKHDFLEIRNIEFYPGNRVFIYSRWGDEVYKTTDYNNTNNRFTGVAANGNELAEGTYYYVIELNGRETVENGFFLLRR